ncbi:outer membrane beta-barrel protein [uncultured Abyssibacter sp.]|uniref:outer membrane beta-barrel protein n=1 Tax=uncultured Abyssibacter sp. TaxID=2320202 RepID=UPI0032B26567
MKKILLGSALLALPLAGQASDPFQHVDVYFLASDLEISTPGGSGDDDGDGFGISGAFRVADQAFLTGEFQSAETDDFDIEIDQLRFGGGFHTMESTNGMTFYGQGEYLQVEIDGDDEDGFGLHGGLILAASEQLRFNGQLGYLSLDDVDGLEYLLSVAFDITPNFGLFADYRVSTLEDDNDNELDLTDVKLGVSLLF